MGPLRREIGYTDVGGEAAEVDPGLLDRLLATALDVAASASAVVAAGAARMRATPEGVGTTTKSSATDPVTEVDTASERHIRGRLATLRPGDAFLGEEATGDTRGTGTGVTWIVDPIDGTVNFLYGVPAYAVSIAATIAGRVVVGVVVDVPHGVTYSAVRGRGAERETAGGPRIRLRPSGATEVPAALVATGFAYAAARRERQGRIVADLLPRVRDIRRLGAAALDLCRVADGSVDAFYEHGLEVWDWSAGALIAAEAGAVVSVPGPAGHGACTGREGRVVIASAPGVADGFRAVLGGAGADVPLPL